jgi:hypothetical protein
MTHAHVNVIYHISITLYNVTLSIMDIKIDARTKIVYVEK